MKELKNYNITVFGDSIPKGLFLEDGSVSKIEYSAVDAVENIYGISIDNRSVFGQTVSRLDAKKTVENFLNTADMSKRTFAVFCLGGNDADFDWRSVAASPDAFHEPKTPVAEFCRILCQKITLLRSLNVGVWLTAIPPIDSERYFRNVISKIADADAVMKFFKGDLSNINRHQECYNDEIMRIAAEQDCEFVNIRREFLLARDFRSYIAEDGVHPNSKGHALIADCLLRAIESYVLPENTANAKFCAPAMKLSDGKI